MSNIDKRKLFSKLGLYLYLKNIRIGWLYYTNCVAPISAKLLADASKAPVENVMERQKIIALQTCFNSRLETLSHLLTIAECHFADDIESLLHRRIITDMLPFGTQIAFTCNQPRNFALWCAGEPDDNLNPDVVSLNAARQHISSTQDLLASIEATDEKLSEIKRLELGQDLYLELPGFAYVDDFLMPNFYFHLTTAYDIMRMAGAPIGKRDFMLHLMPLLKRRDAND